ncbi:MAG: hypothetical protein CTR54_22910 [Rhizobium sp.]|nr:MAG: hypothetical protein CTR54_22910 [Rhizobium sp.]
MTPFGVAAGRGAAGRAGLSVAVGRWDAGAGAVSAFSVAAGRGAAGRAGAVEGADGTEVGAGLEAGKCFDRNRQAP